MMNMWPVGISVEHVEPFEDADLGSSAPPVLGREFLLGR